MGTLTHLFKYTVTALFLVAGLTLPAGAQQKPLDTLYQELLEADAQTHERIAGQITNAWERSGSPAMDLLLRRGAEAMEEGAPEIAVEHFTALVDHAPDFAEGYHARASAYFALGLAGPALDDLRQAVVLNPRHFEALYGFAVLMEEFERFEDAQEGYDAVLALYPLDPGALAGIARLELQRGGQAL